MAFQDMLADLEQENLTADQYRKLKEIRELAEQRGLILNPSAQPNPRNEALVQAPVPAKTFNEYATDFLTKDIPEIGAATYGGMEGARQAAKLPLPGLLKPLGIAAGGVVGATTGLTALRAGRRSFEQGAPISLDQLLAEGERSGLEAATGEGVGMGLRLLGKSYQLGRRALLAGRAGTPEELGTMAQAERFGVHLRPADVTLSPAALRTEQTLRSTQAGSDLFKRRDMLNQQNFEQAYNTELTDVVANKISSQERGKLIQDVLEQRSIPEYQDMARKRFDELRQVTGGEKIVEPKVSFGLAKELAASVRAGSNPKIQAIADELVDRLGQRGLTTGLDVKRIVTPGSPAVVMRGTPAEIVPNPTFTPGKPFVVKPEGPFIGKQEIPSQLQKLEIKQTKEKGNLSESSALPRPLDFMEAHEIRSRLGELSATGETLPGKAQGVARELWRVLGLEMEQGALKYQDKTGVPLTNLWRKADDFVKVQGHELFDANVISKVLKANPEDVVKEAFKPNGLTEVQRITEALRRIKDEPGFAQWNRGVLEQLWQGGIVKSGSRRGEFSGSALADEVQRYGDDTVKAALGHLYPKFKQFVNIASHMDPKSATGTGMSLIDKGVLVSAPLAGVGGAILTGSPYPLVSAGAAVGTWLIATHHFARILNDPQKASALLKVAKMSPGTEAWTRAVGQLMSVEGGETVFPRPTPMQALQQAPTMNP